VRVTSVIILIVGVGALGVRAESGAQRCNWLDVEEGDSRPVQDAAVRAFGGVSVRVCEVIRGGSGTPLARVESAYTSATASYRLFYRTLCGRPQATWECDRAAEVMEPLGAPGNPQFALLGGARPKHAFQVWTRVKDVRYPDREGTLYPLLVSRIERLGNGQYRLSGSLNGCAMYVLVNRTGNEAPTRSGLLCF
jgi:hypothetical protein